MMQKVEKVFNIKKYIFTFVCIAFREISPHFLFGGQPFLQDRKQSNLSNGSSNCGKTGQEFEPYLAIDTL